MVGHAVRVGACALALAVCAGLVLSPGAHAADPTVVAVGDMACGLTEAGYNGGVGTATRCRQRDVSNLIVNLAPSALLDLGDNQYLNGELVNYNGVYDPTFGRMNSIVYPSLGNAEYGTANAQGFFDYFQNVGVFSRIQAANGDASHLLSGGYYSFDIGTWHVIALNSNCAEIGGCVAGSPEEVWLKADLAAHPNTCTIAYWHHPRWNSGSLGNDSSTAAFWTDLYNARADLVLNGHGNHHYERYVLMSPAGVADPTKGIREFIVSTGGESHGTPPTTPGNSGLVQASDYTSFGALELTLHPTGYDWQFLPAAGGTFTDSGTGSCHAATPMTVPDAPSLTATGGDSDVSLSWTAPSDGGAAITAYRVYRGTSPASETLLTSVGNVTSYQDTSAANGTTYFYRVTAVNSVGESAQSNEVSSAPAAAGPPSASVLDAFSGPAGPLSADWQSPGLGDSGTVSIASSGLAAGSGGASSATWRDGSFAANQEVYLTVPTLPKPGDYVQLAGRVSTLGTTRISCYFLRVTPSTATWDVRKKINGATATSVQTFNAPLNAGDSIALQLVGPTLNVYRRPSGGAWSKVGSTADTAIAAGGYTAFTLGDTTARATSFGAGNVASTQVPGPPALTATAGDSQVSLAWTAPTSDGGAAITGYEIYRGTSSGTETHLASAGTGTSFLDTTAVNGTTYYYQVAAVNSVGGGTPSNEVAASPAAAVPPGPQPPSTSPLDAFNASPGPLSSSWQSPALSDPGTVSIASSGVTAGSAGASSAAWNTTFAANQEVYLTVPVLPKAGDFLQVVGRLNKLSATGVSCYFLRVTPSTGAWDVRKKINGATSTSIQAFTAPFSAGDTMALQLVGSTLNVFHKAGGGSWSLVGSTSDSTLTGAGYVAFTLGDTTARGGTFGGGTLATSQ